MSQRIRTCAATLALLALLLASCAKANAAASSTSSLEGSSTPSLEGPWAEEMMKAYEEAESDFARKVLSTGQITENDLAEAQKATATCLEGKGFTNIQFDADGVIYHTPPAGHDEEAVDDAVATCQKESGYDVLSPLFFQIRSNPNNEDWEELVVQCMKNRGAVDSSFTVEDYNELLNTDQRSKVDEVALGECEREPLAGN